MASHCFFVVRFKLTCIQGGEQTDKNFTLETEKGTVVDCVFLTLAPPKEQDRKHKGGGSLTYPLVAGDLNCGKLELKHEKHTSRVRTTSLALEV